MTAFDEKAVSTLWDANAEQWISLARDHSDPVRELFILPAFMDQFLPAVRGLRVLDLGCGEGQICRALLERGALAVTGVDISPRMIAAARNFERSASFAVRYECCSFRELAPCSPSSVDLVVSVMALMDSPGLVETMKSAFRVLVPDGSIWICTLHPDYLTSSKRSRAVLRVPGENAASRGEPFIEELRFPTFGGALGNTMKIARFPYSRESYLAALENAGFRIDRVVEPRPSKKLVDEHPELFGALEQNPMLLLISANKP